MAARDSDQERIEKKKKEDEEKRQLALETMKSILAFSEKYSHFSKKKLEERLSFHSNGSNASGCKDKGSKCFGELKLFKGTLRPYQIEGVLWLTVLYENGLNGILADEMGLGKTIQVIALLCYLMENVAIKEYIMIVLPLSTMPNWVSEFKRFAPDIPFIKFHGSQEERKDLIKVVLASRHKVNNNTVKPVILTNYETIAFEKKFFHDLQYHFIVLDEGQRIKNHLSQTYLNINTLHTKNKLLLTGTPLQNNLKELWSLLHYLLPHVFKDIDTLSCLIMTDELQDNTKLLETERATNVITKLQKIVAPFMMRRLKKDVLNDLVPKKEMLVYCRLTEMQKELYLHIIESKKQNQNLVESETLTKRKCTLNVNYTKLKDPYFENEENISGKRKLNEITENENSNHREKKPKVLHANNSFGEFSGKKDESFLDISKPQYKMKLNLANPLVAMKKCVDHLYTIKYPIDHSLGPNALMIDEGIVKNSGKMIVLDALLKKLKAKSHKVLIFSTFVTMLDLIEDYMIMRNYNYRKLIGSHKIDLRDTAIKEFNTDETVFAFLLSTRAGGLGLNLTGADTVIFYDRDWNPQVDIQAQDRCHRIGQTKPVMVYTLVAKGTVDEKILAFGERKRKLEKIVITSLCRESKDDFSLEELKEMLEREENAVKVNANGLLYSDNELNALLDRSDMDTDSQTKVKLRART